MLFRSLLAEAGALAFTDADHAVGNAQVMRRALYYCKAFDALIVHLPAGAGMFSVPDYCRAYCATGGPKQANTKPASRPSNRQISARLEPNGDRIQNSLWLEWRECLVASTKSRTDIHQALLIWTISINNRYL